uniref:WLM domain-containing protein n=1 Tax=Psilocybe cubensis TaxID=181762 RepID=A0A8H7Y6U7_PSICU
MPDIFVQSFTHLKDKPNADKALHTLQRVASLVKPIMRKHNWVLPVLAEFFPDNPNLLGLNVNMGQEILVRLRPAHSPSSFLPEADVVGTMLHELTHNVHGPHDEKFYKYLDGLQDEYDALQRSGYAGEGFFSEGKRLGTNISHNLPPHLARLKALEAAEKRVKASKVLGSGGRLGGSTRNTGLSPRELASRAAEKRLRDEKSCGTGAEAQREVAKAAKESVTNKVIDLTLDDDMDIEKTEPDSDSNSEVILVKDLFPRPTTSAAMTHGFSTKNSFKSSNITIAPSSKPTTKSPVTEIGQNVPFVSAERVKLRPSGAATNWSYWRDGLNSWNPSFG